MGFLSLVGPKGMGTHQTISNKAVSDGAVWFHLSHMVTARIARYSYGTFRNVDYKPGVPEHECRLEELITRPSGRKLVPNRFSVMLAKVRGTPTRFSIY